ncbi:thiopeptide-type bacteriocin biosynthesis domain-containing protein [Promicromonospora umidemergens]|uniref:Thiopeptide-type bacteriocin biosynthesis domain-containing protein n=2 Tax=Promicromonospora TaxID=43676 RepID=A0ABP8Y6D4_9MICO|nr:thiopeptide-type bacteriocin biosynthesis protein [Promicromonospora umidemergens]MCP2286813.1 thiopeptide-type bacteriocin biosynthesis domain-containing protein [Promicromonospora umidemergens]
MPADQLTRSEPLAAAVMDALTASVPEAADRHGIASDVLADAVDAYTTAGLAALTPSGDSRWTQANISLPSDAARDEVARALDDLGQDGAHLGWWFLNKPPGWRIRLLDADRAALARSLDVLRADGVIAEWTWSVYEPETTAFGGAAAAICVHDLFCADTRGVLAHRAGPKGLGSRETSVLALAGLARGARLDMFETGDMFAKVAALRPPVPVERAEEVRHLAEALRPHLLAHPDPAELALIVGDHLELWMTAFQAAGSQLADLASTGHLQRGLRSVLAQVVIFHWNRLDLSVGAQTALAGAAVHALLPGDNS